MSKRNIGHKKSGSRAAAFRGVELLEARLLLSNYSLSALADFPNDGLSPEGSLIADSNGDLFGTTSGGGSGGNEGTVFEIAAGGNTVTTLASFNDANGSDPSAGVILDSNGDIFGDTQSGGANGDGAIFELPFDSSNHTYGTITLLASLNYFVNGQGPQSGLVMDSAGNLYGAAQEGGPGVIGAGTVFELPYNSTTQAYGDIAVLASFNATNGDQPDGGVILDSSGNLYGAAESGGANFDGTIFEIVKGSGTITTLATFNSANGKSPVAGLIFDSSGNLFGTAEFGGANGVGAVFELAHGASVISDLASFNFSNNGADPISALTLDSSGDLFGAATVGGANSDGTAFEVVHNSGTITALASFNNTNGNRPTNAILDSSGDLFGTTAAGGPANSGVFFEIAHGSGTITALASFNNSSGFSPAGGVIMDSNGNLFGVTPGSNSSNDGTIFEILHGTDTAIPLTFFNGANGDQPLAGLVMDSSGNLFGTTQYGGNLSLNNGFGLGVVFELPHGSATITVLGIFNGPNGANPVGGVILDSSGDLFGTAQNGGAHNFGVIYEIAAGSGTIADLASFKSSNGANPVASVVMDSSGNLYGTASAGGPDGDGVVFKLASGSTSITVLASFNGADGGDPTAPLILDSQKNIYGTDAGVLPQNHPTGSVFEVVHGSGVITDLVNFNQIPHVRQTPSGALVMDSSGNLFGATTNTGTDRDGIVFEVVPATGTLTTLFTFNNVNGDSPAGSLIIDSQGDFYGTTSDGGDYNNGIVFKISRIKKLTFAQPPADGVAGALAPVVVNITDVDGGIASDDNANIKISLLSGPGLLTGTTKVHAVDGVASFDDLSLTVAGTYTFTVTDNHDGLTKTSAAITINPGPAAIITFSVSPANTVAGVPIAAFTVKLKDMFGNKTTNDTSTVHLSIATGPSNGTLGGTDSAAVANGSATFNAVVMDTKGSYTLRATDGSLSVDSASFSIAPAAAAKLFIEEQPTNAVAGQNIATPIVVDVEDSFGNICRSDASTVKLKLVSGPTDGILEGMLAESAVGGAVAFTNVSFSVAGPYILKVKDGTLTPADTSTITVS